MFKFFITRLSKARLIVCERETQTQSAKVTGNISYQSTLLVKRSFVERQCLLNSRYMQEKDDGISIRATSKRTDGRHCTRTRGETRSRLELKKLNRK